MSGDEFGRIKGDLAVMQRAIGLRLSFGKAMLLLGTVLMLTAVAAAAVSLLIEDDRLQQVPFAAILILGLIGAYLQSRRNVNLSPEITTQVLLSITTYAVVWVAACGYRLAAFVGPFVGAARTTGLYGSGIGLLLAFSVIWVRTALRSRERYYCLGLAVSTLLAGMLLPVLDRHYSYPLAHCCLAVGYLTGVAIQWFQLREAVADHAAD